MAHTIDLSGFRVDATEKVINLLAILNAISADSWLSQRVCLHGGTALNIFVFDAPRLSVDIDLNYIGYADRESMMSERDDVEQALIDVSHDAGFAVTAGRPEHSGRKFLLRYTGNLGPDQVKVDLDYLNRSPLLPIEPKTVQLTTGTEVTFPVNSGIELFAGKTKALVERVAVRDLYDISQISRHLPLFLAQGDQILYRRVLLYYLSLSGPFPRPFIVSGRFDDREKDVVSMLYPMLLEEDRPTLRDLIETAETYLSNISQAHEDPEKEYLLQAAQAQFVPELLFDDYPQVLAAARSDPSAKWKMQNLSRAIPNS